ncbi:nucleotidyltransferase, partial [Candidatus Shapirobacteria bacterium CG11_big_fil_rev_8_21_14_0_20_40_12]
KLVDYDENWLNMLADRNLVVHLYEEEMADEIYGRLAGYLSLFEKLYLKLKSE